MADLTPNASMAIEARRGLKWAEDGRAGDGLVPRTVTDARKMADREALSEDKVRRMPAWFARHSVDMSAPANANPDDEGYPGPGRVAWALWGGDAGRSWAERKVKELNAEQERSVKVEIEIAEDDSDEEEIIAEHPGLTERQAALYSAYEKSAEEYGLFNTGIGPDGAHYIAENPFYESEGIGCKACAFYEPSAEVEGQGNCEIVAGPAELEGRVAAEAVCKLWIVPAEGQQTSPQVDGEEEMPPMETEALGIERVKVRLEELRVAASGDPDKKNELVVTGYAALFDSRSEDLGGFVEEIDRGAFAEALKRSDLDVRFLINHDSNLVLARTRSGTLELTEDQRGLRIYARVAPYSYAEDLRIAIERGDVDQMSFAFTTEQDSWDKTEDGMNLRRVERVKDLFDVSVVTYPAYPETKTEVLQRAMQRGAVSAPESSLAEVVPADERESSETEVRTEQSPDQGAELSRLRELIRSRTK
jgi:HK97 family phage prohead protease